MRSPLLILLIVLPCLPAVAGCGGSGPMARAVWIEFGECSIAHPHSTVAGLLAANSLAAARIWSAATQVIGSAHSGE